MICSKCKVNKPDDAFHWRKRGITRQRVCSQCSSAYKKSYYESNQAYRSRCLKGGYAWSKARRKELAKLVHEHRTREGCVDCGLTDWRCLDSDHVRGKKAFGISYGVNKCYPWPRIKAELLKCDTRCANCHRIRTIGE